MKYFCIKILLDFPFGFYEGLLTAIFYLLVKPIISWLIIFKRAG